MGGCYLALREYLKRHDGREDCEARRTEARAFVREYERALLERYPTVELKDVLRGEEIFARAHAALTEGEVKDASSGFEQVIALMPTHYPSWGNLGAAYLAEGRKIEAARCLERALEINPSYDAARQNLALLRRIDQPHS
jgi:tetratricopeptide (TPR) repeat protein